MAANFQGIKTRKAQPDADTSLDVETSVWRPNRTYQSKLYQFPKLSKEAVCPKYLKRDYFNPFMPRIQKSCAVHETSYIEQKDVRRTYMKFYCSTQRSTWDITILQSHGKCLLHRIFSLFLSFYEAFFGFFSLYRLALRIGNAKFIITIWYVNMYVWTQKLPKTFLNMPIKYCETFKSFGELGKKFLY